MNVRGTESPMDFEWQGQVPTDPNSAFHRYAMENQKKRPYGVFDSPFKAPAQELREPNSQPFLFSQPSLPSAFSNQSPYRAPSFTTPRKPFDVDFSSGPENSSPAEQADNEDTPDTKSPTFDFAPVDVKPKEKRNSLFGIYGRFAPSPGRGDARKNYSTAIAKKIHKKRRRAQEFERQLVVGHRSSNDTSEEETPRSPGRTSKSPQEVGWMTGLFMFIHKYPDAPSIIAKYLQLFFNAVICAACLYLIYGFWSTIISDVNKASEDAVAEVLSEMGTCTKHYIDNRCGGDQRMPALEAACIGWELCMNRDPNAVRRAKLSAHTFAEIINSFVEPISLKTMLFSATIVSLALLVNNATFSLFRRSQEQNHPDMHRAASGTYGHPMHQTFAATGQLSATPGLPYGQHQQIGWADYPQSQQQQHQQQHQQQQQQRIDYMRTPSKEHRARSRSPEKRY